MLKVRGVASMVINAGTASLKSCHVDLRNGLRHQNTDQNQSRRRGIGGNRGGQWRAESGQQKKRGDRDIAQAGARAGGDSGCALDVAGHGRGSGQRAERGSHGVCDQNPAHAGNFAVS